MALAHHLITVVYNILKRRETYVELGGEYHNRRNKTKVASRLVARLAKLGYQVQLMPTDIQSAPDPPPLQEPHPDPAPELDSGHQQPSPAKLTRVGRPCKCAQRNIPCKHGRVLPQLIETQEAAQGRFS